MSTAAIARAMKTGVTTAAGRLKRLQARSLVERDADDGWRAAAGAADKGGHRRTSSARAAGLARPLDQADQQLRCACRDLNDDGGDKRRNAPNRPVLLGSCSVGRYRVVLKCPDDWHDWHNFTPPSGKHSWKCHLRNLHTLPSISRRGGTPMPVMPVMWTFNDICIEAKGLSANRRIGLGWKGGAGFPL